MGRAGWLSAGALEVGGCSVLRDMQGPARQKGEQWGGRTQSPGGGGNGPEPAGGQEPQVRSFYGVPLVDGGTLKELLKELGGSSWEGNAKSPGQGPVYWPDSEGRDGKGVQ